MTYANLKLISLALLITLVSLTNAAASAEAQPNLHDDKKVASSKEFPCPAAQDIFPCICSLDEDELLYLVCEGVGTTQELESIFEKNFPVTEFFLFRLQNSTNVTHLGNIFSGLTFEDVDLFDNEALELISDEFLLGSVSTLKSLYVHNSILHRATFPFLTLPLYSSLGRLDVRYSAGLTSIPKLTSDSLLYVSFTGCAIQILEQGTFDGIPNAIEIHVDSNALTQLDASAFQLTNQMTTLQLRDNNISYLDPSAIIPAPSTEMNDVRLLIDLSGNALTELQTGTFQFSSRPFILNLDRNSISYIEPGTFVLPSNTDPFSLELRLSVNQLTEIPQEVFEDLFPYITTLQLYDNPLECGCDVAWIVLNSTLIEKIGNSTTCYDGTNFHDLNPAYYEDFC